MKTHQASIEELKKSIERNPGLFDNCVIDAKTFLNAAATLEHEFDYAFDPERSSLVKLTSHPNIDVSTIAIVLTVTHKQFFDINTFLSYVNDVAHVKRAMIFVVIETNWVSVNNFLVASYNGKQVWITTIGKTPALNVDNSLATLNERVIVKNHSSLDTLSALDRAGFADICEQYNIKHVVLSNLTSSTEPAFNIDFLRQHVVSGKKMSCLLSERAAVEDDYIVMVVEGNLASVHVRRLPQMPSNNSFAFVDVARYVIDVDVLFDQRIKDLHTSVYCRRTVHENKVIRTVNSDMAMLTEQIETNFVLK